MHTSGAEKNRLKFVLCIRPPGNLLTELDTPALHLGSILGGLVPLRTSTDSNLCRIKLVELSRHLTRRGLRAGKSTDRTHLHWNLR